MTEKPGLEPGQWELWHRWQHAQRLLTAELDRELQRDHGISKAEFSVLLTLRQAPGRQLQVGELGEALAWEKSRVSHLLTRMESRGLVQRTESGARRTGVRLTDDGYRTAEGAVLTHGSNLRQHFFAGLAPEQEKAIRDWSEQLIARLDPQG
jgi:DNA-binding MarR family transcriptional regulator